MSTEDRGLGSNKIGAKTKHDIQSKGGKASHSSTGAASKKGDVVSNHAGGGSLSKEDQRKGGRS